jgi:hypothetical protein
VQADAYPDLRFVRPRPGERAPLHRERCCQRGLGAGEHGEHLVCTRVDLASF